MPPRAEGRVGARLVRRLAARSRRIVAGLRGRGRRSRGRRARLRLRLRLRLPLPLLLLLLVRHRAVAFGLVNYEELLSAEDLYDEQVYESLAVLCQPRLLVVRAPASAPLPAAHGLRRPHRCAKPGLHPAWVQSGVVTAPHPSRATATMRRPFPLGVLVAVPASVRRGAGRGRADPDGGPADAVRHRAGRAAG
eukprot:scaffold808_cov370-Prasinococcus_capsulatus_cf.AAC.22